MDELIELLKVLADDQLTNTQASLIEFNGHAERTVEILKQMKQAATEAAAAIVALQSQI